MAAGAAGLCSVASLEAEPQCTAGAPWSAPAPSAVSAWAPARASRDGRGCDAARLHARPRNQAQTAAQPCVLLPRRRSHQPSPPCPQDCDRGLPQPLTINEGSRIVIRLVLVLQNAAPLPILILKVLLVAARPAEEGGAGRAEVGGGGEVGQQRWVPTPPLLPCAKGTGDPAVPRLAGVRSLQALGAAQPLLPAL